MQSTPGEDCYRVDAKLPRGQEEYRNILLMNTCAQEATTHTRSIHDSTVAPSSSLHALLILPPSFLLLRLLLLAFFFHIPPSSSFLLPIFQPHIHAPSSSIPILTSLYITPPNSSLLPHPLFHHLHLPSWSPSLQFLPPVYPSTSPSSSSCLAPPYSSFFLLLPFL